MGLITILVEGLLISSGIATVRRVTGYSLSDYILPKLTEYPFVNNITSAYFCAGEFIVTFAEDLYYSKKE